MGVKGRVTSPTFIIAREHDSTVGGPRLIHVDAYRLLDSGETDPRDALDSLDIDSELDDSVLVAEWGGGLVENLQQDYLLVQIARPEVAADVVDGEEERTISWEWHQA